eukprot:Anaeramoba_ignava/a91995_594.p1 GENE.a91995_594~~a91995_594.p1  ORF type:complete len:306 (-),score=103.28 a91995_594:27-944(-)
MDCCVVPLQIPGYSLVQTTDFFFPSVNDCYVQGRIAACNVLSDLYAMGLTRCDNMLMLLGVCTEMEEEDQDYSSQEIIRGFNDTANEAGTQVRGGQTTYNPWPLIGGVATVICKDDEIILPENAQPGDKIILTKPLGTQITSSIPDFLRDKTMWSIFAELLKEEEAEKAAKTGVKSMSTLNKTAAELMKKYHATSATDVTGFGFLGHSKNLLENQKKDVSFVMHTLPCIKYTKIFDEMMFYGLQEGTAKETSGGLLFTLPAENAQAYIDDFFKIEGYKPWIVGDVVEGKKEVVMENLKIEEVLFD